MHSPLAGPERLELPDTESLQGEVARVKKLIDMYCAFKLRDSLVKAMKKPFPKTTNAKTDLELLKKLIEVAAQKFGGAFTLSSTENLHKGMAREICNGIDEMLQRIQPHDMSRITSNMGPDDGFIITLKANIVALDRSLHNSRELGPGQTAYFKKTVPSEIATLLQSYEKARSEIKDDLIALGVK